MLMYSPNLGTKGRLFTVPGLGNETLEVRSTSFLLYYKSLEDGNYLFET